MAGRSTKRGTVYIQVSAARSAVLAAKRLLEPRKAKLDKLPGYSYREFLALEGKIDQLQQFQRLLGEKDAAGSASGVSHTLPELFEARAKLLRRAQADAELQGKVITSALVASVTPGSGPKDGMGDLIALASAYLKPGAPKTPYTPAQLKALVQTATTVSRQLGVKVGSADRKALAEQRDALAAEIARVWKLTVLANAWFDLVEGGATSLPRLMGAPSPRKRQPAAPTTQPA